MARHFLQLYLLIVATLLAASWGQERLWEAYEEQGAAEEPAQAAALKLLTEQLRDVPSAERRQRVADLAARTGLDLELFDPSEIAGHDTLARLAGGEQASMHSADGQTWMLKSLRDDRRVLAFRYEAADTQRSLLDWALALVFYAVIALVIMIWLWPLTRDLRRLERSTLKFGDRNWAFDADIKQGSQIYPLAEAFRRMAARIDSLISSHKEMSNALAHDIKTPLARMRFEIEMARAAKDADQLAERLNNINADIAELNTFVAAALDYAILERAEVALNVAAHDFTVLIPAITESVRRSAPSTLSIRCDVASDATAVSCDGHLMETVVRNLLYNAIRYARREIRIAFLGPVDGFYALRVEDDGPGIPEADRKRVFDSFVRLDESTGGGRPGHGLGLAIVKRVVEWHRGQVAVSQSVLGGACFSVHWPRVDH
jgi:two-component system OmpR family sensor kinase